MCAKVGAKQASARLACCSARTLCCAALFFAKGMLISGNKVDQMRHIMTRESVASKQQRLEERELQVRAFWRALHLRELRLRKKTVREMRLRRRSAHSANAAATKRRRSFARRVVRCSKRPHGWHVGRGGAAKGVGAERLW